MSATGEPIQDEGPLPAYELYGSRRTDIEELRVDVERALDIQFVPRSSLYLGEYYRFGELGSDEKVTLQLNEEGFDDEPEALESDYPDHKLLLYVSCSTRDEPVSDALRRVADLDFLRREVIFTAGPMRERPRMFRMLITTVARLGWPVDDQVEYLQHVRRFPEVDELLTEASMALDHQGALLAQGWLNDHDLDRLAAIERGLDAVQQAGDFDADRLASSAWQELRSAARAFLMGEEF